MNNRILVSVGTTALLVGVASAQEQDSRPVGDSSSVTSDQVVVTARRREESVQTVPVAISVFSGDELDKRNIENTQDLTYSIPGVTFVPAGGIINPVFAIRGQNKTVLGNGAPSVVVYLNEVPMPYQSSTVSSFDLASVQVLKGPQGTYFGRNTTGGAVLYTSAEPGYEFEGYVQATAGSYDRFDVETAVTVPFVEDVLSLRIAGLRNRQDGYVENVSGAPLNDRHEDALRFTLLFEPTNNIRNVTVYDYSKHETSAAAGVTVNSKPGALWRTTTPLYPGAPALADYFDCNVSIACDIDLKVLQQTQWGPYKIDNGPIDTSIDFKVAGLSNTTTVDLGSVTVKNIFGYRRAKAYEVSNSLGLDVPLVNAYYQFDRRQFSEELQLSGELLGSQIGWLVGGFYYRNAPAGDESTLIDIFRPINVAIDEWALNSLQQTYVTEVSRAAFGQLTFDMSDAIEGLSLNAGFRYTWDRSKGCNITGTFSSEPVSPNDCASAPGSVLLSASSSSPTWTLGADYKLNSNVFLYVTARQGYKAGSFNSPLFNPAAPNSIADYQQYGPEKIRDLEIGTKTSWSLGGIEGRLNIAAFRGKLSNAQSAISLPPNFDGDGNAANDPAPSLLVNFGEATLQGVEVDGEISPATDFTIGFAAAYLDAEYTNYEPLPVFSSLPLVSAPAFENSPDFTIGSFAEYTHDIGSAGSLRLYADVYWSDTVQYGVYTADQYYVVNARLDWLGMLGSDVDASVFVRNLTGNEYVVAQNVANDGFGADGVIFAPPRMIGVQLRYAF